jgi:hypothetical protein
MGDPSKIVFSPERVHEDPSLGGFSNEKEELSRFRLVKGSTYRDCSTVCLLPTRTESEALHYKVADAYKALLTPMNQKFTAMRLAGMEVADAYNSGVQQILNHPDLSKWKFILTYESDNTPPPDGLVKLLETIYAGPWAGVSGLYWTKGETGVPMIFGNPKSLDLSYRPQIPEVDAAQECRGIAMGFALWDIELFRDKRLGPPWFKTLSKYEPHKGVQAATQDLEFCGRATEAGYRFCVDTRVRVGHVQFAESPTHAAGFVW